MSGLRIVVPFVLGLMVFALGTGPVGARQAGTGDIPSDECFGVRPLGFLALLDLADDLNEQSAMVEYGLYPQTEVSLDDIDQEPPVSAEDLEGITAAVRTLVACVNQQDPLRLLALFTDTFQAGVALELIGGSNRMQTLLDEIPVFASQVEVSQQLEMFPIDAAWYTSPPAKSVSAVISPIIPGLEEQRSYLVQFAYEKDWWLIDGIMLVERP